MGFDLLAAGAPPPSSKILLFAGIFCVLLVIVLVVKRREERIFARPYEEEAGRIGRVRCDDCRHEGPLSVEVRVRTPSPYSAPAPESAALVCSQCQSPRWTALSRRRA